MTQARRWLENALAIVVLLLLGGGCASVTMDSSSADAQAKQFTPASGTASLYFCRDSGIAGNQVAQVQMDGLVIGSLAKDTFLIVSVNPGHHVAAVAGRSNSEQLPIDAEAGKNYFFNVSITWAGVGVRHRNIEFMSEADGRNAVNKAKRAAAATNP
jgi:hypothetical protein